MPHRHVEKSQLPFDFPEHPKEVETPPYADFFPSLANAYIREHALDRFLHEVKEPWSVLSPRHAADYLFQYIFPGPPLPVQEETWSLMLNVKYRITHHAMVYRGQISSVPIRLAEILRDPVRVGAANLILVHNHPSGDPTPSPEDVILTQELKRASDLLGIDLMDHIVVGEREWVSLREQKLGFK